MGCEVEEAVVADEVLVVGEDKHTITVLCTHVVSGGVLNAKLTENRMICSCPAANDILSAD